MPGIDHTHVQDMAKLIAAMSATEDGPTRRPMPSIIAEDSAQPFVRATAAPVTPDTAAMARIMDAFSSATNDIVATSETYPELKRALVTEATATGSRVGSWEIAARNEGSQKYYDVTHAVTQEPIARDLRLYDAALSLVDALNEGETINSMRVRAIFNVEDEYSRALTDAVQFAQRMKVTEGAQYDIAEDRYAQAKQRAMTAKKALASISKLF